MHMHVLFFSFLNVRMTKIKQSIDLNYIFSKVTILTIFFSKMKVKPRRHFAILNLKLLSTLEILMIQIKYNGKSVIDYLKEEFFVTLFFLIEKDTCDTFKSKDDSSIKLLFAKDNCK